MVNGRIRARYLLLVVLLIMVITDHFACTYKLECSLYSTEECSNGQLVTVEDDMGNLWAYVEKNKDPISPDAKIVLKMHDHGTCSNREDDEVIRAKIK